MSSATRGLLGLSTIAWVISVVPTPSVRNLVTVATLCSGNGDAPEWLPMLNGLRLFTGIVGATYCRAGSHIVVSRLHAALINLSPGGITNELNASDAMRMLNDFDPVTPVEQIRYDLAHELFDDIWRLDKQLKASHHCIKEAVRRVGDLADGCLWCRSDLG
jgi:hypothetical protein